MLICYLFFKINFIQWRMTLEFRQFSCQFMILQQIFCYIFTEHPIIYQPMMHISLKNSQILLLIIIFHLITLLKALPCSHDLYAHSHNQKKVFLNDLTSGRLLQTSETGRIRIFVDYSQVRVGGPTQINTVKRIMNITASYFYNLLNVTRLTRLYFPQNTSLSCNVLKVPETYQTLGVIGDLGIMCGNQQNAQAIYIARSISCVFLQSTKRPIWGMIMFNNNFLKYDQQGFQQTLLVGMHEMTHVLGFSAAMYETYPKGNPLVKDQSGQYYLNSSEIQQQIKLHFGCNSSKGLPLQDQDGTLIASHWERKVMGNEYMIATNKKNSFVSNFTLALFETTGWYVVNRTYSQPAVWGKGKGCQFLNIDQCNSQQFCTERKFFCDFDGTGIGRCDNDPFVGTCMVPKYFVNTICVDQNYQLKNLNSKLNALQRGGSTSRCFQSDFREEGQDSNPLNNRCYVSVCSITGRSIFILVGSYILVCSKEGQVINAPVGLNGTLTCPRKFNNYCSSKKTCPYHCNKNGVCINGKCQCTGQTKLSTSCADVSILKTVIGETGGLVNAFKDLSRQLNLFDILNPLANIASRISQPIQFGEVKKYSIDSKCMQGSAFDKVFGQCLPCQFAFNCQECDDNGCIVCDNGTIPRGGAC